MACETLAASPADVPQQDPPGTCSEYVARRRVCGEALVATWPAAFDPLWDARAQKACEYFVVEKEESAACLAEEGCEAFASCAAKNEQVTISRDQEGCTYLSDWLEGRRPDLARRADACCENGRPDVVTQCAQRPPDEYISCMERTEGIQKCRLPSDPPRRPLVPAPMPLKAQCARWGPRAKQCQAALDQAAAARDPSPLRHPLTLREACSLFQERTEATLRCLAMSSCQDFAECSVDLARGGWAPPATPETCQALATWVEHGTPEDERPPTFVPSCIASEQIQRKAAACFQSLDPRGCAGHLLETFPTQNAPRGTCDQLEERITTCHTALAKHPVLPPDVPIPEQCESSATRRAAWEECAGATSCDAFALCVSDRTTDGWVPPP